MERSILAGLCLLLLILLSLPGLQALTCQGQYNQHSTSYFRVVGRTQCYERFNQQRVAYTSSSLPTNLDYNYRDNIAFVHDGTWTVSWCYYASQGNCYSSYSGCCCGCSGYSCSYRGYRHYYRYWDYTCPSQTMRRYRPCHPFCASCNSWNSQTSCTGGCWHKNGVAYRWLTLTTGTSTSVQNKCYNYCPKDNNYSWNNAYTGQYIAATGNTVCSRCHQLCAHCEDLQGGNNCRSCISSAYLHFTNSQCNSRFPGDSSHCQSDAQCVSSCPADLYFNLAQASTSGSNYPLTAANADYRRSNVCYLCHKYCERCNDYNDNSQCTQCANSYYHWQQSGYGERCSYYCKEGDYSSYKGEYVLSTSNRNCYQCDTGCNYCQTSSSNCYECMNGYYLLDDRGECLAQYSTSTCDVCNTVGTGGGKVTSGEGCATRDKLCQATNCPEFFYFELERTGASNVDNQVTNSRYDFFTQNNTNNPSANGYEHGTTRASGSTWVSPDPAGNIYYRQRTNLCKLCDFRCLQCYGPSNFNCTSCVNGYYKWTNESVCSSACPTGSYKLDIDASYPDNETKCANCDPKCIACEGYSHNCSSCTIHPSANYAFLYTYVEYNATCMTDCLQSTTPLTEKGYYGSITTMLCYACPGGCSNCNIDYVQTNHALLKSIVCTDDLCTRGIVCTSCLQGYNLVEGQCVDQETCGRYAYYLGADSGATWSPTNCRCLEGYYFSSGTNCELCSIYCLTCSGPDSNNCLSCPDGWVLSGTSCSNSATGQQVKDYEYWSLSSQDSDFYTNYPATNTFACGTYTTLFGYRDSYTTGHYFRFRNPSQSSANWYAMSFRLRVLFIDEWDSIGAIYFRVDSTSAYPSFVYNHDTAGAIGEQQCGTNTPEHLVTINGSIPFSPSSGSSRYYIYVSSTQSSVENSSGFYYKWGVYEALFTLLQCHSDCATCSGPNSTQCLTCSNSQKRVVDGSCICDTSQNYFIQPGSPTTCMTGCPDCTSNSGDPSTWCYYRDYNTAQCVNPPVKNCSAPQIYGYPFQRTNSYGTCRQDCSSSSYYAVESLMKCTSNCAQFNLYHYPANNQMRRCVEVCPNGLIANPYSDFCVTRCPDPYYLKLQNATTNPMCTDNCPTGFEYDIDNTCVESCPGGYYTQTLSSHNKCVQTCTNAFGDNVTHSCVTFCPSPSIADPSTNLCVNECPLGTYLEVAISDGNRSCVSMCEQGQWLHPYHLNCSKNPKDCPEGTYADNNTNACEFNCTVLGQVGENTTRMCQTSCDSGYAWWDRGLCVAMCPEDPPLFGWANFTHRICVSTCNTSTTNLYADQQAGRTCVYTCSAGPTATFGNLGTQSCVKQCPVSNQYGDPFHANRLCVTTCTTTPDQTYSYFLTKLCVAECPQGYFGDHFTTSGVGICATSCPVGYYGRQDTRMCVDTCPWGWYGSQLQSRLCMEVCPLGEYAINLTSTRVCVAVCDDGYWADNYTRHCYNYRENCTNNTFADAQKKLCVVGTNCTTGTYADPVTIGCESNCTNSTFFGDPSTNLCVQLCPANPDYYSQYGYCTATCADGMYADWQANRSCVTSCTITPQVLYGTSSNRCVRAEDCGANLFGNNNTQLCSACSGSLPYGDPITHQCTNNCSQNYYGDDALNLCQLSCNLATGHYADNQTGTCVTLCTEGTFGVNFTSLPMCQFECPANSYAKDTNRLCMANCLAGYFGDPITNKCYNSSLNCSDGYFGNTVTNMCVKPEDCQTIGNHYYADNDTKMCVQQCADPLFGYNDTYYCMAKCPEPVYGQNNTRTCVAVTECGNYGDFADAQNNLCVDVCTTSPVLTFAQNSTYTCVTPQDCPSTMVADNITQTCVLYCPYNTTYKSFYDNVKTHYCVETCPEGYYGDESNHDWGLCAQTCPGSNYFRDDTSQLCVYTCPSSNNSNSTNDTWGDSTTDICVQTCPSGWFAQPQINRTCVTTCQANTWGNQVTRMCITDPVNQCPSQTWADNYTHLCTTFCTDDASNSSQKLYGQNITKLCVKSCPSPSFAFIDTRVCIDECPITVANTPGYFGDPDTTPTRLCVLKCLTVNLYRDVANNRTCQPTCTYNSTYRTYRDPTSMTCVSECPNFPQHLYAQDDNTSDPHCASSCTVGIRDDSNMSCVSSCSNLYDATENRCVDKCPYHTSSNKILYANLVTMNCVEASSCPANTYANDDTLQCVSTCPNDTYISGSHCVSHCPDGEYINLQTASCVLPAACPSNYFADNLTRTCVSQCSNGTFGDTDTRMCIYQCYGSNYGDATTLLCSSSCSSGLLKEDLTRTCVGSCDPGFFYNPLQGKCTTTCQSPYFANTNTTACVTHCTANPMTFSSVDPVRACVTTCPSSAPWYDLIDRQCVATCPTNHYRYDLNVSCVAFCPEPYYQLDGDCVLNCSTQSKYSDDTTRTCVTQCPLGYFRDPTTFKCVVNCPESPTKYYADDSSLNCVTNCPNDTYADDQVSECVASCSSDPQTYGQPNTWTCVNMCPVAYSSYADTNTSKCVTECPTGYFTDDRERKCLNNCSNTKFADSLTTPPSCVFQCSSSTYADPITFTCVTNCSAPYFSYGGNRTCTQQCPHGTFADPVSRSCVTQCTDSTYQYADSLLKQCTSHCTDEQYAHKPSSQYYGQCVYYCPATYFANPQDHTCVQTCPAGRYGSTYNNTCQTSCRDGQFKDDVNHLCQTTCPSADNLFGQPFDGTCVTVCNSTLREFMYADGDSRRCETTCTAGKYADDATYTCVGIDGCSSGTYSDPYMLKCVQRCYNNTYAYNKRCYSTAPTASLYANPDTQSYTTAANCPNDTFADPTKNECVYFCDIDTNRYANNDSQTCELSCTSPLYADNITRSCVTQCPDVPQYYGETGSRICVVFCDTTTYGDPSLNLCVGKCSDGLYGDNTTRKCLTECPEGTFADNNTNLCVATCPSNPSMFGDPTIKTCVYHCSSNLYADQLSNRQCRSTCASPYFSQNSTMTCETGCLTGFANPRTRQCIENCTQGYYGYNRICHLDQCPSANPIVYADDDLNLCVTSCPNGTFGEPTNRKCVEVCPVSLGSFADLTNRVCVSGCTGSTYADSSLRHCVTTCSSAPALFSFYLGNQCVAECTNGLYADNSTRSCVGVTSCPNGTFADNSTFKCVSYCPSQPMMWADPLEKKCVHLCSSSSPAYDYYADNAARSCVQNCSNGTYADPNSRTCKPVCPDGLFGVNDTGRCQTTCPSLSFADVLLNLCVARCSVDPVYYGDQPSHECKTTCPSGSYGNPITQECVYDSGMNSSCPMNYYAEPNSDICVEVCPMKLHLYADPLTKKCITSCTDGYLADNSTMRCVLRCPSYPDYYADTTNSVCVKFCPNETFADNSSRVCVATCPNGTYAQNSTWRCVDQCLNAPLSYRDPQNWKCVAVCPEPYYVDIYNLLCMTDCPTQGESFATLDTRQCLKVCHLGTYAYLPNRTCLPECINNTFADNTSRTCLDVCPRDPALFADNTSMTCVETCPDGMFAFDDTRECVYVCPVAGFYRETSSKTCVRSCNISQDTFTDNQTGNCVTQCSNGTFADVTTGRCVSICSDQPLQYARNDTRTCVDVCPDLSFGQNTTRVCVAVCPSGSLSFTDTHLCLFECPITYYAYEPTQFCLSQCQSPYYGDPSTRKCVLECPLNQLLFADNSTRTCVKICPDGSYAYQWSVACLPSCPITSAPYVQTYAASYDNTCVEQCAFPFYSYQPTYSCVSTCPSPYFNNVEDHTCILCPTTCSQCTGSTSCTSCNSGYFLQNGACVTSCTLIYYANPTTRTCVVSTGCQPRYGVNSTNTCDTGCVTGSYPNSLDWRCDACPDTCTSCTSLTNCINCVTDSVYHDNFCYGYCNSTASPTLMYFNPDNTTCTDTCPAGTYASVVYCKTCSSECLTCDVAANNCTNCSGGKYIYGNQCLTACPAQYKPTADRSCQFCNTTCGSGLTYDTNITNVNGQQTLYMNFNNEVNINGDIYDTIQVSGQTRLLQASSQAYQIVVIDSQTIQIIFPPGSSYSSYDVAIVNPQNIVDLNGNLPASIATQVAVDLNEVYSTSIEEADSSFPTYFTFLGIVAIFSFIFDLELMRFMQLVYCHYFLVMTLPPLLTKVFTGIRYSTLFYLPEMYPIPEAVLRPNVPSTIYNSVGDYSFLRNAGFAFTPLAVLLLLMLILKILTVPEINRFKNARVWCHNLFQEKFRFGVLIEWVSIFFTNTIFFAFLQLRDYTIYDTFAQVSLILAHLFILLFAIVSVLILYRVVSFYREYPALSENLKKASDILLQGDEADLMVSTNVFLSQRKKIDLRNLMYPKINNDNIFPFRVFYRYNILAMLCLNVTYLRAMVLSMFIALAQSSVVLQMALCIPLNVLALLYFSRARPYSFKLSKYRIKNYFVIFQEVALIGLEAMLLGLGIMHRDGASTSEKESYGNYVIYYLTAVCSVIFLYHIFSIVVFCYRKLWLRFIETDLFRVNFPQKYAEYQAEKNKGKKLAKGIDPKAKQALKSMIKGYKKSRSKLRPTEKDKADPQLPFKQKITFFDRSDTSSINSRTTLSKSQKRQMVKEIFGGQDVPKEESDVEDFYKVDEESEPTEMEFEEYEQEIEIKAQDLAKYVKNAEELMRLKKDNEA